MTPDDPSTTDDTEDADDTGNHSPWWRRLDWHLIVQILLFIIGIKVAFIYNDQLTQMKYSTDAAKSAADTAAKTLNISNRSWLEITSGPPFDKQIMSSDDRNKLREGMKEIVFPLIVTNIGRAPVKNIQLMAAAELLDNAASTTFSYGGVQGVVSTATTNIVYPSRHVDGLNAILFEPGSVAGNPNDRAQTVTPEIREDLRLGKKYFVAYARGTFEDDLGKHWVNFCSWTQLAEVSANFSARSCTEYNGTGDFKQ